MPRFCALAVDYQTSAQYVPVGHICLLLVKGKPLNNIDGSVATHHINSVSVQVIHYGYDREFVSVRV